MIEAAWAFLFGGICFAMICCGVVDLLEDYSDEKKRRKL